MNKKYIIVCWYWGFGNRLPMYWSYSGWTGIRNNATEYGFDCVYIARYLKPFEPDMTIKIDEVE